VTSTGSLQTNYKYFRLFSSTKIILASQQKLALLEALTSNALTNDLLVANIFQNFCLQDHKTSPK